ncbi:MAG: choice-of-anchor V domain-containing protein [Bacteroidia bacterium]
MKFKILYLTLILISSGVMFLPKDEVYSHASGAPAGYTGSPLEFSGRTCGTGGGCHGGGVTDMAGWITSDIPDCGYTPGQTYNISVFVTSPGRIKFGFSCSPQHSNGNTAGTLIAGTGMQLNGSNRYITHTSAGTAQNGTNSRTWTFQWTAPAAGSGNVTFYSAMNATNSSNTNSGDLIFKSSLSVNENSELMIGLSITGNTFCDGSTVTLGSSGGSSGNNWIFNGQSVGTNGTLTVSTAGIYELQHTSGNCIRTAEVELFTETFPETPEVSFEGDTVLCPAETIELVADGDDVTWQPSGTMAGSIMVSSAGTYTATRSNTCGTASSAEVVLVSENVPVSPQVTSDVNFRLCADSMIVITAVSDDEIMWTPGNVSGTMLDVTEPGSYSAVATNVCGDSEPTQVEVVPRNIPEAPVIDPSEINACEGEELQLTASNFGFEDNVTWNPGNIAGPVYFPETAGTVTAVVSNLCGSSPAVSAEVNLFAIPEMPVIMLGGGAELIADVVADSFAWYFNGTFIENENDSIIESPEIGEYTVTAFNAGVCASAPSAAFNYDPTFASSSLKPEFNLYPNPNTGVFSISGIAVNEKALIQIFDNGGRLVFAEQINGGTIYAVNAQLAPGHYLVKLGNTTKQLVVTP